MVPPELIGAMCWPTVGGGAIIQLILTCKKIIFVHEPTKYISNQTFLRGHFVFKTKGMLFSITSLVETDNLEDNLKQGQPQIEDSLKIVCVFVCACVCVCVTRVCVCV